MRGDRIAGEHDLSADLAKLMTAGRYQFRYISQRLLDDRAVKAERAAVAQPDLDRGYTILAEEPQYGTDVLLADLLPRCTLPSIVRRSNVCLSDDLIVLLGSSKDGPCSGSVPGLSSPASTSGAKVPLFRLVDQDHEYGFVPIPLWHHLRSHLQSLLTGSTDAETSAHIPCGAPS
ncbi:hypothetical protein R3Q17_35365 [Rhodococcus opacus]|nr:hypothetical protein [Rhodococcus opacus]